jgi:MFS family permease
MERHGYRSALRHRDFRLLISTFTVAWTGAWAYNVALWIYVYEQTHSYGWVGATTILRFVPSLIFSAYAGVIAERYERVRLLIVSRMMCMVWMALLALSAALQVPVAITLALAVLNTITSMVNEPAERALTPQIVGEEDLAVANALTSVIENLVVIAGPAIGAAFLLFGSPAGVFALTAFAFGVDALITSRVRTRSTPVDVTEGGKAGPFRQMAVGVKTIAQAPLVALLVGYCVVASFIYGTDTVLYISVSNQQLGTGSDGTGYLLAGLGVGGILMAAAVNRLAASPRLGLVITLGMLGYCLPTALLVVIHSPEIAVALQVIRGAGTLVVDVLAITALQRSLPSDRIARVFGAFTGLVLLAITLGAFITPILLRAIGLHDTLLWLAFAIPAVAVLSYVFRLAAMDKAAVAQVAVLAPKVALLQSLGIFAKASRSALEQLAKSMTEQSVPTGGVIIREGDPADALYVLVDGRVDVHALGEGVEPHHLRTMDAGSYFGEIGLLENIPRTATITALTACTLYRIDGADFTEALTNLSASTSLLEGAKTRLALTHPSRAAAPPSTPAIDVTS